MTDILDRIDATIAAWEAAPESWVPGDPLYKPGCVVRRMFDLIDDNLLARRPRCVPCGVSWAGPEPCWMCGEDRLDLLGAVTVHTPSRCMPVPIFVRTMPIFAGMIRAAVDFERAMARTAAQMAEATDIMRTSVLELDLLNNLARAFAAPPTRNGPPPLPIDGHAYHNRTRRRTRRNR